MSTPIASFDDILNNETWKTSTAEERGQLLPLLRQNMFDRAKAGQYHVVGADGQEKPAVYEQTTVPLMPQTQVTPEAKRQIEDTVNRLANVSHIADVEEAKAADERARNPVSEQDKVRKAMFDGLARSVPSFIESEATWANGIKQEGLAKVDRAKAISDEINNHLKNGTLESSKYGSNGLLGWIRGSNQQDKLDGLDLTKPERVFPGAGLKVGSSVPIDWINVDGKPSVLNNGDYIGGKYVAIPQASGGKTLTPEEAAKIAQANGLENYPSFDSKSQVEKWIAENGNSIDENGVLSRGEQQPASREFTDAYAKVLRSMIVDKDAFKGNGVAAVNGAIEFDLTSKDWQEPDRIKELIANSNVSPLEKQRANERVDNVYQNMMRLEYEGRSARDWFRVVEKSPRRIDPETGRVVKDATFWDNFKEGGSVRQYVGQFMQQASPLLFGAPESQAKTFLQKQIQADMPGSEAWKEYSDAFGVQDRSVMVNDMVAAMANANKAALGALAGTMHIATLGQSPWAIEGLKKVAETTNGIEVIRGNNMEAGMAQVMGSGISTINTIGGTYDSADVSDLIAQVGVAMVGGHAGGIAGSLIASSAISGAQSWGETYGKVLAARDKDGNRLYNEQQAEDTATTSFAINGAITAAVTLALGKIAGATTNPKEFWGAFQSAEGGFASKIRAGFNASGFVGGIETSSKHVGRSMNEMVRDAFAQGGWFGKGGQAKLLNAAEGAMNKDMAMSFGKTVMEGLRALKDPAMHNAMSTIGLQVGKGLVANIGEESAEEVVEQIGQTYFTTLAATIGMMPAEARSDEGWFPEAATLVKVAILGGLGGAIGHVAPTMAEVHSVVTDGNFRKDVRDRVAKGIAYLNSNSFAGSLSTMKDMMTQQYQDMGIDPETATPEQHAQVEDAAAAPIRAAAQSKILEDARAFVADPTLNVDAVFRGAPDINMAAPTASKAVAPGSPGTSASVATAAGNATPTAFPRLKQDLTATRPPLPQESSVDFVMPQQNNAGPAVTVQMFGDSSSTKASREGSFERIFGPPQKGMYYDDATKAARLHDINVKPLNDGTFQVYVAQRPTTRGYDPTTGEFFALNEKSAKQTGMTTGNKNWLFNPLALQRRHGELSAFTVKPKSIFSRPDGDFVTVNSRMVDGHMSWTVGNEAGVDATFPSDTGVLQWLKRNNYMIPGRMNEADLKSTEVGTSVDNVQWVENDDGNGRTHLLVGNKMLWTGPTELKETAKKALVDEANRMTMKTGKPVEVGSLSTRTGQFWKGEPSGQKAVTRRRKTAAEKAAEAMASQQQNAAPESVVENTPAARRAQKAAELQAPTESPLTSDQQAQLEAMIAEYEAQGFMDHPDNLDPTDWYSQDMAATEANPPQPIATIGEKVFETATKGNELAYNPHGGGDFIDTRLARGSVVKVNSDTGSHYFRVTDVREHTDGTEVYSIEAINNSVDGRRMLGSAMFNSPELIAIADAHRNGAIIDPAALRAVVVGIYEKVARADDGSMVIADNPNMGRTFSYRPGKGQINFNAERMAQDLSTVVGHFKYGEELNTALWRPDFESVMKDFTASITFQIMEEIAHMKAFKNFSKNEVLQMVNELANSESRNVQHFARIYFNQQLTRTGRPELGQDKTLAEAMDALSNDDVLAIGHEVLANLALIRMTGSRVDDMNALIRKTLNRIEEQPAGISAAGRIANRLVELGRRYVDALRRWWAGHQIAMELPKQAQEMYAKLNSIMASETNALDYDTYNVRNQAVEDMLGGARASTLFTNLPQSFYAARRTIGRMLYSASTMGISPMMMVSTTVDDSGNLRFYPSNVAKDMPGNSEFADALEEISNTQPIVQESRDRLARLNTARGLALEQAAELGVEMNLRGLENAMFGTGMLANVFNELAQDTMQIPFYRGIREGVITKEAFDDMLRKIVKVAMWDVSRWNGASPAIALRAQEFTNSNVFTPVDTLREVLTVELQPATKIPGLSSQQQLPEIPAGDMTRADLLAVMTDMENRLKAIGLQSVPVDPDLQDAIVARMRFVNAKLQGTTGEAAMGGDGMAIEFRPAISRIPLSSILSILDPDQRSKAFTLAKLASVISEFENAKEGVLASIEENLFGIRDIRDVQPVRYVTRIAEDLDPGVDLHVDRTEGLSLERAQNTINPLPLMGFRIAMGDGVQMSVTEELAIESRLREQSRWNTDSDGPARMTFSDNRFVKQYSVRPFSPDGISSFAITTDLKHTVAGRTGRITRSHVENAISAGYEILGLRGDTSIDERVTYDAQRMLRDNVPSITRKVMKDTIRGMMLNDPNLGTLDVRSMGFPLRSFIKSETQVLTEIEQERVDNGEREAPQPIIHHEFAWPDDLFVVPMLYNPDAGIKASDAASLDEFKLAAFIPLLTSASDVMMSLNEELTFALQVEAAGKDQARIPLQAAPLEGWTEIEPTRPVLETDMGLTPSGLVKTLVEPHLLRVIAMLASKKIKAAILQNAANGTGAVERRAMVHNFYAKVQETNILAGLDPALADEYVAKTDDNGKSAMLALNSAMSELREAMIKGNSVFRTARYGHKRSLYEDLDRSVRNGDIDVPINNTLLANMEAVADYQRMIASRKGFGEKIPSNEHFWRDFAAAETREEAEMLFAESERSAIRALPDVMVPVTATSILQALDRYTEMNPDFGLSNEEVGNVGRYGGTMSESASQADSRRKSAIANDQRKMKGAARNYLTIALSTMLGRDAVKVRQFLSNAEFRSVQMVRNEHGIMVPTVVYHTDRIVKFIRQTLEPIAAAEQAVKGTLATTINANGEIQTVKLPDNWFGPGGVLENLVLNDTTRQGLMETVRGSHIVGEAKPSTPSLPEVTSVKSSVPMSLSSETANPLETEINPLRDYVKSLNEATRPAEIVAVGKQIAADVAARTKPYTIFPGGLDEFLTAVGMNVGMDLREGALLLKKRITGTYRGQQAAMAADAKKAGKEHAAKPLDWLPLVLSDVSTKPALFNAVKQVFAKAVDEIGMPSESPANLAPEVTPSFQSREAMAPDFLRLIRDPQTGKLETFFGSGGRIFSPDFTADSEMMSSAMSPSIVLHDVLDQVVGLPIVVSRGYGGDGVSMGATFARSGNRMAAFMSGNDVTASQAKSVISQLLVAAVETSAERLEGSTAANRAELKARLHDAAVTMADPIRQILEPEGAQRSALKIQMVNTMWDHFRAKLESHMAEGKGEIVLTDQQRSILNRHIYDIAESRLNAVKAEIEKDFPRPGQISADLYAWLQGRQSTLSTSAAAELLSLSMVSPMFTRILMKASQVVAGTETVLEVHPVALRLAQNMVTSAHQADGGDVDSDIDQAILRDQLERPDSVLNAVVQARLELEQQLDYGAFEGLLPDGEDIAPVVTQALMDEVTQVASDVETRVYDRLLNGFSPVMELLSLTRPDSLVSFQPIEASQSDKDTIRKWHAQQFGTLLEPRSDMTRVLAENTQNQIPLSPPQIVRTVADLAAKVLKIGEDGGIEGELYRVMPKRIGDSAFISDPWEMVHSESMDLGDGETAPIGSGDFNRRPDLEFIDSNTQARGEFEMAMYGLFLPGQKQGVVTKEAVAGLNSESYTLDVSGNNLETLLEKMGMMDDARTWTNIGENGRVVKNLLPVTIMVDDGFGGKRPKTILEHARDQVAKEVEDELASLSHVQNWLENADLVVGRMVAMRDLLNEADTKTLADWNGLIERLQGASRVSLDLRDVYNLVKSNSGNVETFLARMADHLLANLEQYAMKPHSIPLRVALDEIAKDEARNVSGILRNSPLLKLSKSIAEMVNMLNSLEPESRMIAPRSRALRGLQRKIRTGQIKGGQVQFGKEESISPDLRQYLGDLKDSLDTADSAMDQSMPRLVKDPAGEAVLFQRRREKIGREISKALMKYLDELVAWDNVIRDNPVVRNSNAAKMLMRMPLRPGSHGNSMRAIMDGKINGDEILEMTRAFVQSLDDHLNDPVARFQSLLPRPVAEMLRTEQAWDVGPYNTVVKLNPNVVQSIIDTVEKHRRLEKMPFEQADAVRAQIGRMNALPLRLDALNPSYQQRLVRNVPNLDPQIEGRNELRHKLMFVLKDHLELAKEAQDVIQKNLGDVVATLEAKFDKIAEKQDLAVRANEMAQALRDERARANGGKLTAADNLAILQMLNLYFADKETQARLEKIGAVQAAAEDVRALSDYRKTRYDSYSGLDKLTANNVKLTLVGSEEDKRVARKVITQLYQQRWVPANQLVRSVSKWSDNLDMRVDKLVATAQTALLMNLTNPALGGEAGRAVNLVFVPDAAQSRLIDAYEKFGWGKPDAKRSEQIAQMLDDDFELGSNTMFDPLTYESITFGMQYTTTEKQDLDAIAALAKKQRDRIMSNLRLRQQWLDKVLKIDENNPGAKHSAQVEASIRAAKMIERQISDLVTARHFNGTNTLAPVVSADLIDSIDKLLRGLETGNMKNIEKGLSVVYAQFKAETEGKKVLEALVGGYIEMTNYKMGRYLLEQNALATRMFGKTMAGVKMARNLLAWIEYGMDGKTGRNGFKAMEVQLSDELKKAYRAVKKVGEKSKMLEHNGDELGALGYMVANIYGGVHGVTDTTSQVQRLLKLRAQWLEGFFGLQQAKAFDKEVAAGSESFYNSLLRHGRNAKGKIGHKLFRQGYYVTQNYEGTRRNLDRLMPILDQFVDPTQMTQTQNLPTKANIKNRVEMELAKAGFSSEEIAAVNAYAETLVSKMSELQAAYSGLAQLNGGEAINSNPVPPRFKVIARSGVDRTAKAPSKVDTMANNLLNMGRSLLTPSTEYNESSIRALDVHGLRGPTKIISDMLYRMNVAPSYGIVRQMVGEAELVKDSLVSKDLGFTPVLQELAKTYYNNDRNGYNVAQAAINVISNMVSTELEYDRAVKSADTYFEAMLFRAGQYSMFSRLVSLWQKVRQTWTPFVAYAALTAGGRTTRFDANGNPAGKDHTSIQAFGRYLNYVKSGLPVIGDNGRYQGLVSDFVAKYSHFIFTRGAEGMEAVNREISWSKPMGKTWNERRTGNTALDVAKYTANVARKGTSMVGRGIEQISTKGLDFTMAKPEMGAVRSIFTSEVYRLTKLEQGRDFQFNSMEQMLTDKDFVPAIDVLEEARANTILIMAQSDSSKKAVIFHRNNSIIGNMIRGGVVLFANHMMTTAAHSQAGWQQLYGKGVERSARANGARMIGASIAQNVAYTFFTYNMAVKAISMGVKLIMAGFGAPDDEQEKMEDRIEDWLFGRWTDNPDDFMSLVMQFMVRSAFGSRGEIGYDMREYDDTEDAKRRAMARYTVNVFKEIINQSPYVGMVASTGWGSSASTYWYNKAAEKLFDTKLNFDTAGWKTMENPDGAIASLADFGLKWGSYGISNYGDVLGYPGLAAGDVTKALTYPINARQDSERIPNSLLELVHIASMFGTRDMRGFVEDVYRRERDVEILQKQEFPKGKKKSHIDKR